MLQIILGKMSTVGFYTWSLLKLILMGIGLLLCLRFMFHHVKRNAQKQQARVREVQREQARKHEHRGY